MRDSPPIDEDFTAFVAARSPALYRSAWLFTTSAPAAVDLVQSALAKTYVHWRKVQAADDPAAYVHGIVLKTFLSNRRRRSNGEIPVDATPGRPSCDPDPTERIALLAALRTLPPLDRAVVAPLLGGPLGRRDRPHAAAIPRGGQEPLAACARTAASDPHRSRAPQARQHGGTS
ncbi:MAG: sigE 12 [Nocardioides sp.]|uniref:sigma factor n=1 Tax=Nocardioides sp. TaxID=35761 RepID=UPI00262D40BC|nr:sigma factor [Nocardioides sp.]MCW2835872.1 sigE 12 [Nocardioides sp.]